MAYSKPFIRVMSVVHRISPCGICLFSRIITVLRPITFLAGQITPRRRHRRGAHCAPFLRRSRGFSARLLITAYSRPTRPHCGQEGGNQGFPLLVNHPLSFRARCARKSKSRFPSATRLPGQGKQNGCHPKGAGARCAPLREGNSNAPVGWNLPFLLFLAGGRRKLYRYAPCARSAPLFAAANAANLRADAYLPALTQKETG